MLAQPTPRMWFGLPAAPTGQWVSELSKQKRLQAAPVGSWTCASPSEKPVKHLGNRCGPLPLMEEVPEQFEELVHMSGSGTVA